MCERKAAASQSVSPVRLPGSPRCPLKPLISAVQNKKHENSPHSVLCITVAKKKTVIICRGFFYRKRDERKRNLAAERLGDNKGGRDASEKQAGLLPSGAKQKIGQTYIRR